MTSGQAASGRMHIVVASLVAAMLSPPPGRAAASAAPVIVRRGAGGAMLVAALARRLPEARVLELSGDLPADSAMLSREARDAPVLFAVGPDATEAAADARGPAVVSVGVANPAQVRTAGTYVSIYPPLDTVFAYLKGPLAAERVGLVFSPARNREVGVQFLRAGAAQGVTVVPVPVASAADLVRELPGALDKVDVVVLAVDPVLFDARSVAFLIAEARTARKPVVGFLEDMVHVGVTLVFAATPDAAAEAAVGASATPVTVGKKRIDPMGGVVVVSREAAAAIGLDAEALHAQRIE